MEIMLTSEAKKIMLEMYKYYREQRENGISRDSAKFFGDVNSLMSKIDLEDNTTESTVADIVSELFANKLITGIQSMAGITHIKISDSGIAISENATMKDILNGLKILKEAIPFL